MPKMTVEQIDAKIQELSEKKKQQLLKQKQKALQEQRKKAAQKRKLENRVKYIIGGYVLAHEPAKALKIILDDQKTRDQDKKTLEAYKASLT